MFSFDQTELIWEDIEQRIYEERQQFSDVYAEIEQYLTKYANLEPSCIIVGGVVAINILLEKKRSWEDFVYLLYTDSAFYHANTLINILEEKTGQQERIMFLKTVIPNIKYQIIINNRVLVSFYRLTQDAHKIIKPFKRKFFEAAEVLIIPPEIYMIETYRDLYLPSRAEDWEDILNNETRLFHLLHSRVKSFVGQGELHERDRQNILLTLLKEFVQNNKNVVLIGEQALQLIAGIKSDNLVLQVISQNDIEADFYQVQAILGRYELPLTKHDHNLNLIQDHRLRRTTIKIGAEGEQKEVIYIYNAAQYDLIPFNVAKHDGAEIQVGNPFVIMRFLLIEFWIVRWIQNLGMIHADFAEHRLEALAERVIQLRLLISEKEQQVKKRGKISTLADEFFDSPGLLGVFPSEASRYLGYYVDETIATKLVIKNLRKKYGEYYPREYKLNFGHFREVELREANRPADS